MKTKHMIWAGIVAVAVIVLVLVVMQVIKNTDMNEYDDSHRPPDTFHTIKIYANYPSGGTIAEMEGEVRYNEVFTCEVTSVSVGFIFEGWFAQGVLVEKAEKFECKVPHDMELEARFFKVYDASFTITQTAVTAPMDMTLTPNFYDNIVERTWVLKDVFTGKEFSYTENENDSITVHFDKGTPLSVTYTITYADGKTMTQDTILVINESIPETYVWRYEEPALFEPVTNPFIRLNYGQVTWHIVIPFTGYYYAAASGLPRTGATGVYGVLEDFITEDARVITHMVENLMIFSAGMSEIQRADFVLKFVQSLQYQRDIDGTGQREYYKLPTETLWDGKGDCEDHAILYATLMKAMGYEVVLYHIYCYDSIGKYTGSHVATGVAVPGGSGYSTVYDGTEYFYAETTAEVGKDWVNEYNLGHIPDGYEVVKTWKV